MFQKNNRSKNGVLQAKNSLLLSISKRISLLHIVILFILYVVFSLYAGGRGYLHREMDTRLPAHISGKPILEIIFDADAMNLGGWEARQLSFLFDILDGKFVALCIRLGIPHFRSLTHYLFTLILAIYMWSFMIHSLKIDRLLSLLLIALLFTTPSFIYSYYYRTSKIGVTLLVVLLLGEIYKLIKNNNDQKSTRQNHLLLAVMFLCATLALMLFDILGGFFAAFIIAYLFLVILFKPSKNISAAFTGMVTGYMVWVFYFLYLGQVITLAITGKQADTSYLTGAPFGSLLNFLIADILPLIIDMFRYLFGYVPSLFGAILLIAILELALWVSFKSENQTQTSLPVETSHSNSEKPRKDLIRWLRKFIEGHEPLLSFLFLLSSLAIIYDFLVTRHPPLLWPDVRPTYYIMPAQAVLLFGLAMLLSRTRARWALRHHKKYYFTLFLVISFLLGNITGSINIKDLLYSGPNTLMNLHDPDLLTALAHLHDSEFILNTNIAADPIYLLFSSYQ